MNMKQDKAQHSQQNLLPPCSQRKTTEMTKNIFLLLHLHPAALPPVQGLGMCSAESPSNTVAPSREIAGEENNLYYLHFMT